MVMPSVTCHSPSVAANNTTEQFTCVYVVCGMGGGGGGGGYLLAKWRAQVSLGIGAHRPAAASYECYELQKSPLSLADRLLTLTLYHHSIGSILSTEPYRFSLSIHIYRIQVPYLKGPC